MRYIISIFFIVLSNYKKDSKWFAFFLFFIMWLLFALNTNNADYKSYELMYQGYSISNDIGFNKIIELFNYYSLSHRIFLMLVSFICLSSIVSIIRLYTDNIACVMGLYFIFPFLLDVTQIRNCISMVIVLYGMKYLIIEKKQSILKYVCCILIASTVHITSIFYLLLLLSKLESTIKLSILIFSTSIVLALTSLTNILPRIASLAGVDKFVFWFLSRAEFGFFIPMFIQSIGFLLIYLVYSNEKKCFEIDIVRDVISIDRNCFFKVNIVLFLLFPLYIYNGTFFRLYRNILVVNYCYFASNIILLKTSVFGYFIKCLYFLYVLFLFYYFIINTNFNTVFLPIFNQNIMFN